MKTIDTEKLSREMNDTLIHRACVMRSGEYLARYLIYKNRSVDAVRLLGRCSIHDISKIQNTEEFMSLASIVDEIDTMHNIEHVLSAKQEEAIRLHRKRNSHHPEYYDSPNDMSELDLLEMACDCHARSRQYQTDLIAYIEIQQGLRFHFDNEHFRKLKSYCTALVELTKQILLDPNIKSLITFSWFGEKEDPYIQETTCYTCPTCKKQIINFFKSVNGTFDSKERMDLLDNLLKYAKSSTCNCYENFKYELDNDDNKNPRLRYKEFLEKIDRVIEEEQI